MANKMLIDATHGEETRVVVVRGNKVEEFDFESSQRKQLRGNIYLAKVIRVEPSLQAAFVEYGGNRHGFLAFSEIHPDYYQIPVADRQALLEEESFASPSSEDFDEERSSRRARNGSRRNGHHNRPLQQQRDSSVSSPLQEEGVYSEENGSLEESATAQEEHFNTDSFVEEIVEPDEGIIDIHANGEEDSLNTAVNEEESLPPATDADAEQTEERAPFSDEEYSAQPVESFGSSDDFDDIPQRTPRRSRQYKIQEVIKRRQVILVQVVKEERGNKGAALTTYLSLAGRYSVLMPNTARGGGISRKITNAQDRSRLKEIVEELEVPEGMGVILRTAGANRTKLEVMRDFEYLLRLWETVRETTLRSSAPMLVYEEGNLVKRAIRDLYNKDIDEVLVSGEQGFNEAQQFMRMLMPSHARNVIPYRESLPIFAKFGVEHQLDAMFSNEVTLRSGGYIVINQTEALVAIDVNSGRSTREHNIEDTALKTNLEAAEEIARQLRLRDLAGLVVCDFIDMEEKRNNRAVEKRMKDCLKNDRARIQIGHISHFGLLEMSRQRMRTGVLESSTEKCKACSGSGVVRSIPSKALNVLRSIEDYLLRNPGFNLSVATHTDIALYVLNQKRQHVFEIERRFGVTILFTADDNLPVTDFLAIQKGEAAHPAEAQRATSIRMESLPALGSETDDTSATFDEELEGDASPEETSGLASEGDAARRKRRRRRRRGGRDRNNTASQHDGEEAAEDGSETDQETVSLGATEDETTSEAEVAEPARPRRRGRRGGRNSRPEQDNISADALNASVSETEVAAASSEQESPTQHDEAESTQQEPEPKERTTRSRTRRRTAKPAPEATSETSAPSEDGTEATPVKSRSRKAKVEPETQETVVSFPSVASSTPPATQIDETVSERAALPKTEPQPEEEPAAPTAPRRTGWWQRKIFGGE